MPLPVVNDGNSASAKKNLNHVIAVPITDGEVPGPSSVQTVTALVGKTADLEPVDRAVEEDMIVTVAEVNTAENRLDNADVVGECSVHRESVMLSELDDCTFKTPQKRRLEQSHSDEQAKKGFICDVSQTDTESENDFSECSAPCSSPQSRSSSKSYSADDIKSFLKETKNMRKVCIEQYFPDVIQFLDKVRMYRNEGCFSNQEVYRLKKILAKLNTHLEPNVSNEK